MKRITRWGFARKPAIGARTVVFYGANDSHGEAMSSSHCVLRTVIMALAIVSMHSPKATEVVFCTDAGSFTIELNEDHAPLHTANFLRYVDSGHYSGTVFHRVIADFMIQGGGYDASFAERPAGEAIENESRNGLSNRRGTVAAARTADPHSATAQFYVNVADNDRLDGSEDNWGYSVFGRVTEGMESVDAIAARSTGRGGPFPTDVPTPLVKIHSAARIARDALTDLPAAERSDRLRERIRNAITEQNHSATLDWISRYRSTCEALDPALLVAEATAAAEQAIDLRAQYALEQYFATAPSGDPSYDHATALYARLAPGRSQARPQFTGCRRPAVPDVPDGSVGDLATMISGQTSVQDFMRQSNTYLECLDRIIDDDKNEPSRRESALLEYNRVVDVTRDLGDRFNEQVRVFRARQ
jgi:cyclophilin family peptidyl-prolyl cis-trans isomerase